jgi:D-alanyl-D-alanine carboxypeptidase
MDSNNFIPNRHPNEPISSLRRALMLGLASGALKACGGTSLGDLGPICYPNAAYQGPPLRSPLPSTALPLAVDDSLFSRELPESTRLAELARSIFQSQRGVALDIAVTVPTRGAWRSAMGETDVTTSTPVSETTEFWWASVGKSITATLILIAEARGQLKLSDEVARFLPSAPHAASIKISQLLVHTNGLLSFNHPSLGDPSGGAYESPTALLERVSGRSLLYCAGTQFGYTNTGYLLLGLIAEAIWRAPFHEIVDREIASTLALTRFRALAPREIPANLAKPHTDARVPSGYAGISSLLGAGNIVANAPDMLKFWIALCSARFVTAERTRERWQTLYPMGFDPQKLWYGEGVMASDFRDQSGRDRLWLLHSGGGANANAIVIWDPLQRAYIAVAASNSLSTAAVALALLNALDPPSL